MTESTLTGLVSVRERVARHLVGRGRELARVLSAVAAGRSGALSSARSITPASARGAPI